MTIVIPVWLAIAILIVIISPSNSTNNQGNIKSNSGYKDPVVFETKKLNLLYEGSKSKSSTPIITRIYSWIITSCCLFTLVGVFADITIWEWFWFNLFVASILALPFSITHYVVNRLKK